MPETDKATATMTRHKEREACVHCVGCQSLHSEGVLMHAFPLGQQCIVAQIIRMYTKYHKPTFLAAKPV